MAAREVTKKAFAEADKNHDGALDRNESRELLRESRRLAGDNLDFRLAAWRCKS